MELTPQERDKFQMWLIDQIQANKPIIQQMETMNGLGVEPVLKIKKQECAACVVVTRILNDREVQTIER